MKTRLGLGLVLAVAGFMALPALAGRKKGADHTYLALAEGTRALEAGEGPVIGDGAFAYRLRLFDPADGITPLANHPYAFWVPDHDLPFVIEEKDVFQGQTDAQGHSAIFRLKWRLNDQQLDMNQRLGTGDHGIAMVIAGPGGKPMAGAEYWAVVCTDPPSTHRGITNKGGETVYFASDAPVDVKLFLSWSLEGNKEDASDAMGQCKADGAS